MRSVRTRNFILSIALCVTPLIATAQDTSGSQSLPDSVIKPVPTRTIFVNGIAFIQAVHLSLEWPVFNNFKGNGRFNFRLAAGPYYWGQGEWGSSYMTLANYIHGSGKGHFEIGLGWELTSYPGKSVLKSLFYSYPALDLGYRYSNPDDWFMYRMGFNFPGGFYLGFGLQF